MKSVKPRQTADNNPAYKIYLHNEVQCLGHEIELRINMFIHTHLYMDIYTRLFKIIVGVLTVVIDNTIQIVVVFLFNRTALHFFVSYFAPALYMQPL